MSYQVTIIFLWIRKLNKKKTDVTDKSLSVFEKSKSHTQKKTGYKTHYITQY